MWKSRTNQIYATFIKIFEKRKYKDIISILYIQMNLINDDNDDNDDENYDGMPSSFKSCIKAIWTSIGLKLKRFLLLLCGQHRLFFFKTFWNLLSRQIYFEVWIRYICLCGKYIFGSSRRGTNLFHQYLMYREVVMEMMTMKVAMRSDWLSG